MDILSVIILIVVAVCFLAAVRYIFKTRGNGCNGNCSCCGKICSSRSRKRKK